MSEEKKYDKNSLQQEAGLFCAGFIRGVRTLNGGLQKVAINHLMACRAAEMFKVKGNSVEI